VTPASVDPDPTPTASPWEEYLAAAQSLDAVRREAAAAATAATHAVSSARAALAQVTARLEAQRARLTGIAVQAKLPAPPLVPTPDEQAAAGLVDPPTVPAALAECQRLIDQADAELATPVRRFRWPLWLLIVAPLGVATVLLCTLVLVLTALR
jgi:hypothetical protein